METSQWIADKIKHRLRVLGMSKQEFAAMIGVYPNEVSRYLTGKHNFTLKTLVKIERALNIEFFANHPGENAQACAPCIVDKLF